MTSPCFILVAPQMGENIGAAARVMANFGLADLRLVAPRDGFGRAKHRLLHAARPHRRGEHETTICNRRFDRLEHLHSYNTR